MLGYRDDAREDADSAAESAQQVKDGAVTATLGGVPGTLYLTFPALAAGPFPEYCSDTDWSYDKYKFGASALLDETGRSLILSPPPSCVGSRHAGLQAAQAQAEEAAQNAVQDRPLVRKVRLRLLLPARTPPSPHRRLLRVRPECGMSQGFDSATNAQGLCTYYIADDQITLTP